MSTPSLADGVLRPAPLEALGPNHIGPSRGGVTATEPDIEPTSAWRWRKSRCRSRGRLGALRMTGVRHLNHDRFDHRQVGCHRNLCFDWHLGDKAAVDTVFARTTNGAEKNC
jgi:hypothetical protein